MFFVSYIRGLLRRYRHEPTSEEERAEIERRLQDQARRIQYLITIADIQERRKG